MRFRLPLRLQLGRALPLGLGLTFRLRFGIALRPQLGIALHLRLRIAFRLRLGLCRFGGIAPGLCFRLDFLIGRLLARLHYDEICDGSGRDEHSKYRRYEQRAILSRPRGLRRRRVRELNGLLDRRSRALLGFGAGDALLEPRPVGSRHGAGAAVVRGGAAAQLGGLARRERRIHALRKLPHVELEVVRVVAVLDRTPELEIHFPGSQRLGSAGGLLDAGLARYDERRFLLRYRRLPLCGALERL